MNKRTRSTRSQKWRHTRTSVEIAWTNEQKQIWSGCDAIWSSQKSRRRNKKNQEKANNSPSYRRAAIKTDPY